MKQAFENNSIKIVIISIIVVLISIALGITFAYTMNGINVNVTAANIGVDYTGDTTLSTNGTVLIPIADTEIKSEMDDKNVMKISFSVKGKNTNPEDLTVIYDVALKDLGNIDCVFRDKNVKWRLYKDGVQLSEGSLDPGFDIIKDGRLVLTTTQQTLKKSSETADNYVFILWISESCTDDITKCTEAQDQRKYNGKSLSGKIEVELYTEKQQTLKRETDANFSCESQ